MKPIKGEMLDPTLEIRGCRFYERCQYACDRCREEIPMKEASPGHQYRCIL